MEFLLAVQFLTRIPITVGGDITGKNLARSMAYYPIVGLIVGIASALVYFLSGYLFSESVRDFLVITFMIFITGNMHIDAIMDTADGFFSGKPKDGILEIMKDSRAGSHGVVAGILVVVGKLLLLGNLPPEIKLKALIVVPMLGRWALVYGSALYPYARIGGGTGGFTDEVGYRELWLASITALAGSFFILSMDGLLLALAVLIGAALLGHFIYKKIGGITGDTLGATNECIELLAFALLPWLTYISPF